MPLIELTEWEHYRPNSEKKKWYNAGTAIQQYMTLKIMVQDMSSISEPYSCANYVTYINGTTLYWKKNNMNFKEEFQAWKTRRDLENERASSSWIHWIWIRKNLQQEQVQVHILPSPCYRTRDAAAAWWLHQGTYSSEAW